VATALFFIIDSESVMYSGYVIGLTIATVATIAGFVVPWERSTRRWSVVVPLLDVAALALIRDPFYATVPAVEILIIFPMLWLAFELRTKVLAIAFASTAVVVCAPYLIAWQWPAGATEWVNAIVLPVSVCTIALAVGLAGDRVHGLRRHANSITVELGDTVSTMRDREAILLALTDTIDAAIVLYDTAGNILIENEAANRLAAKACPPVESPTSVPAVTEPLIFAQDRTTPIEADDTFFRRALRGEVPTGQVHWVGPDGSQTAIVASWRTVSRNDGIAIGTVVVSHNVTELMETIRVRDEFLGTVSHELRTPLTNIMGYLELIDDADPDTSEQLKVVRKNADRLLLVVSNLLTARGMGHSVLLASADLAAVVELAVERSRSPFEQAGVALSYKSSGEVIADIDAAALTQVVDHLLSNALKFSRTGSSVAVEVDSADGVARLSVSDTGFGISPEHQRLVFDRFFRAPSARKHAIPGAGLGLSIVRSLVEEHNGSITLTSELGAGATFTVRLPTASPRPHSA
jgi:signal transduction histidine kinase